MARIRDALRAYYGRPRNQPHRAPLDELVLTILSQNTNDRNRDVAYARLRERFPSWEAVAAAPVEEVEEAIRPGGISKVKSARIQAILCAISEKGRPPASRRPGLRQDGQTASRRPGLRQDGQTADRRPGLPQDELSWLERAPRERALSFLEGLPGVGRKTAACVLLFAYDRPELPVDTHVYRVSSRLGLIRPQAGFDEAHDVLRELVRPEDVYELHVNLIRHGRRLCRPQRPLCGQCPLLRLCPYGREVLANPGRAGKDLL